MNPIKLIRKLGKVLRGGATSREMFLGVLLGFAIGMTPGLNLTVVALVVLFLLLNTNGALGVLSILLGKALCVLLAPVTFRIGHVMIHKLGLSGLVRAAGDTPVLALLDLYVYCLIGAIPIILVAGIPLAWFVARSVGAMRAGIAAATGKSEKLQKVGESKFARLVMRVVFGKQGEAFADMTGKKSSLIRKGRVIAAAVVIGLLVVAQMLFLDAAVASSLEKSIGAANGAEVNVASVDLSLGGGKLVIEGLQVTDPARPGFNQVQAERIEAKISISDLLARRFVVDVLACDAVRTDVKRDKPGEVYSDAPPAKDPAADLTGILGEAGNYAEQVKRFNEKLRKLLEYLKSDDPAARDAPAAKEDLARRAKAEGYLRLSAKDVLTKRPTWVIRRLTVSNIKPHPDLPAFTAEGRDLSSHPSLYDGEMSLKVKVDKSQLAKLPVVAKARDAIKGLLGGKKDDGATKDEGEKKKGILDRILKR